MLDSLDPSVSLKLKLGWLTIKVTGNVNEKYRSVAEIINRAGEFAYPITDTLIEILKYNVEEKDLDLIFGFTNQISQTMEQLK
jgi:hypothetical protein